MHARALLIATCMLAVSRSALGQDSARDAGVAAFLDSKMRLAQQRDTAALRQLSDVGFRFIHSTGRVDDLAGFLAFAAQGQQDSVRVLTPPEIHDVGAVAYAVTHTATWVRGRGWTAYRSSDVVLRTGNGLRWLGHHSTALPAPPAFLPLSPGVAAAVQGRYAGGQGVVREVRAMGDRLLVATAGRPPVAYGALSETTFRAERVETFIVFHRNAAGRVQYLEVLERGRAERFERATPP